MNVVIANNAKNGTQNATVIFLNYYYLTLVGKSYYKHTVTTAAVWLSCYVYIFAIYPT